MKTFLSILLITFMIGFTACNTSGGNKNQREQMEVVYTCPMHPEVESDSAGTCPKCGMDLVKKDEHNHPDSSSNTDDEIN